MSSAAQCPRCAGALGLSRWCSQCGMDLRPDLAASDIPEASFAAAQEERWLADHPGAQATATTTAAFLPPTGANAPAVGVSAPPARFASLRLRSLLAVR